ncbi:macrophage colony-stimulating factor 1 receptor [Discoglossus pictus]
MRAAVLTLLIILNVRYGLGSPVIEPPLDELVVIKGQNVNFTCSGNDTVVWEKLTSVQRKHVKSMDTVSVVEITSARFSDTGTYKCVYNDANSTGSASLHLFVKDPLNIWNVPYTRLSADEDSDAIISCFITDPSVTQVSLISKYTSKHPANTSFNAREGFTIHNVQMENDGDYVCQATVNGKKKQTKTIRLLIKEAPREPPSVNLEKRDQVRIVGESLQIVCQATSYVVPEITWEHPAENVIISRELSFSGRTKTLTSMLIIPAVKTTDRGIYSCIGLNKVGRSNASASLQVVEKGYVKLLALEKTNIALKVGESMNLTVQIEAYPNEISWNWFHKHLENSSALDGKLQTKGQYRMENTLILNRMKVNEGGNYTFVVNNSETKASLTFEVDLHYPPTAKISFSSSSNSTKLKCNAWGNPLPTITWYQCPGQICGENWILLLKGEKVETILDKEVESVLYTEEIQQNATITCQASNLLGTDSAETMLPSPPVILAVGAMQEHKLFNTLLTSTCVVAVVFLLLSIFLYYKYKQKPKYEVRWQIVQCGEGNNYTCIDPTQLPYNEKWEFPRANLHFGKTLGAGAFGKVIEATAFGMGKDDSALKVAVKMLKPSADTDEVEALMSELKILSHLGHHQNVVNLLGACTSGGPILVITEYCHYGDLLNFLRRKAEAMNNMFCASLSSGDYKNMSLEQKYITSDSGFSSQDFVNYVEMRPAFSNKSDQGDTISEDDDTEDNLPLDLYDLLNFSLQVAQGMAFLASKSCIHRDVAARNVLITHGRTAKICDFGLARDIENDSNYVVKGNARLPVKWMAPESIFDCIYTVQSDVWSYGILLWEIFSLGRSPYPGILVNRKFYKLIKDGYKMDCPDNAPSNIYCMMKACWDLEPTRRPTFSEISRLINRHMGLLKEQDYANIIHEEEDQECVGTKCDTKQPLLQGNNYQFC